VPQQIPRLNVAGDCVTMVTMVAIDTTELHCWSKLTLPWLVNFMMSNYHNKPHLFVCYMESKPGHRGNGCTYMSYLVLALSLA